VCVCLCYILRAIRAGGCRERRYADHTFIQIYFRMHHFVVKFQNFLHVRWQGGIDRLTKILRTFLFVYIVFIFMFYILVIILLLLFVSCINRLPIVKALVTEVHST